MKPLSSKYLYTIFFVFFKAVVFGQGPPPPPGIPIDENNWVLVIAALVLAVYIIYKYSSKRKPAA